MVIMLGEKFSHKIPSHVAHDPQEPIWSFARSIPPLEDHPPSRNRTKSLLNLHYTAMASQIIRLNSVRSSMYYPCPRSLAPRKYQWIYTQIHPLILSHYQCDIPRSFSHQPPIVFSKTELNRHYFPHCQHSTATVLGISNFQLDQSIHLLSCLVSELETNAQRCRTITESFRYREQAVIIIFSLPVLCFCY
jgi:hypothetical protein